MENVPLCSPRALNSTHSNLRVCWRARLCRAVVANELKSFFFKKGCVVVAEMNPLLSRNSSSAKHLRSAATPGLIRLLRKAHLIGFKERKSSCVDGWKVCSCSESTASWMFGNPSGGDSGEQRTLTLMPVLPLWCNRGPLAACHTGRCVCVWGGKSENDHFVKVFAIFYISWAKPPWINLP